MTYKRKMQSYESTRDNIEAVESGARHFKIDADLKALIQQKDSWSKKLAQGCELQSESFTLDTVSLRLGESLH